MPKISEIEAVLKQARERYGDLELAAHIVGSHALMRDLTTPYVEVNFFGEIIAIYHPPLEKMPIEPADGPEPTTA